MLKQLDKRYSNKTTELTTEASGFKWLDIPADMSFKQLRGSLLVP